MVGEAVRGEDLEGDLLEPVLPAEVRDLEGPRVERLAVGVEEELDGLAGGSIGGAREGVEDLEAGVDGFYPLEMATWFCFYNQLRKG